MTPINGPDVNEHIMLITKWMPLALLGGIIGGSIAYVHTRHKRELTIVGKASLYTSKVFMGTCAAYIALIAIFGDDRVNKEHIVAILCGIGGWEVIGLLYSSIIGRLKNWLEKE